MLIAYIRHRPGREKSNLTVTLLDSIDVTLEDTQGAGHGGVGFECVNVWKINKFRG